MTGSSLEHVAACWEGDAETWTRQAWAGYDVYRDHNNTPALIAMLSPIAGLDGIPTPDEAARGQEPARRVPPTEVSPPPEATTQLSFHGETRSFTLNT